MKRVVGFAPVARYDTHRVLDAIGSAAPLAQLSTHREKLDCFRQEPEPFANEPTRSRHRDMSAGRETESEDDINAVRNTPVTGVGANVNDVPNAALAIWVLDVYAVAQHSCIGPWPRHVAGDIEQKNCCFWSIHVELRRSGD